jgi:hypothetical protein
MRFQDEEKNRQADVLAAIACYANSTRWLIGLMHELVSGSIRTLMKLPLGEVIKDGTVSVNIAGNPAGVFFVIPCSKVRFALSERVGQAV